MPEPCGWWETYHSGFASKLARIPFHDTWSIWRVTTGSLNFTTWSTVCGPSWISLMTHCSLVSKLVLDFMDEKPRFQLHRFRVMWTDSIAYSCPRNFSQLLRCQLIVLIPRCRRHLSSRFLLGGIHLACGLSNQRACPQRSLTQEIVSPLPTVPFVKTSLLGLISSAYVDTSPGNSHVVFAISFSW